MKTLMERFMLKVNKTESCWHWIGSKNISTGYGAMHVRGKLLKAHRVSYELFNGKIPEGLYVCHKCDVPSCVNPEHLFVGSALDNTRDKMKKGRYRNGSDTVPHELWSEIRKNQWASYSDEKRKEIAQKTKEGLPPSEFWSEFHRKRWQKRTPEERAAIGQKISDTQKGRKFTPEHLANLRAAHFARRGKNNNKASNTKKETYA